MLYLNAGLVSAFGLNLRPAYRTASQTLADVKFPFTRRAGVKTSSFVSNASLQVMASAESVQIAKTIALLSKQPDVTLYLLVIHDADLQDVDQDAAWMLRIQYVFEQNKAKHVIITDFGEGVSDASSRVLKKQQESPPLSFPSYKVELTDLIKYLTAWGICLPEVPGNSLTDPWISMTLMQGDCVVTQEDAYQEVCISIRSFPGRECALLSSKFQGTQQYLVERLSEIITMGSMYQGQHLLKDICTSTED